MGRGGKGDRERENEKRLELIQILCRLRSLASALPTCVFKLPKECHILLA